MSEATARDVLSRVALATCLVAAGCTGGGTGDPAVPDGVPSADGASTGSGTVRPPDADAGPNFTFAVGEGYRADPGVPGMSPGELEAFFEGALAPLQRLPGLLPRTVSATYDQCGEANAFYDAASATIALCHELSTYARELFGTEEAEPGAEDTERDPEIVDALARSATAFVLYHQVAHALDAQLDLPLAGNAESNMDAIATVIAVEAGRPLDAVAGAALFGNGPAPLAGVHGDGEDRGGDIACWTIGGSALARAALLDADAAAVFGIVDIFGAAGRDCEAEYVGMRDTVRAWLPGLARLGGGSSGPGTSGPDAAPAFRLGFGQRWLQGVGADPGARRRIERRFDDPLASLNDAVAGLPAPVDVVYDACGAPQSFHDPAARTVTLCEELVGHAYRFEVGLIDASTQAELAFALERAYEFLGFALYHEVGHVVHSLGRLPPSEDVESAADAVGAVLLVESGRGLAALGAALLVNAQPPEQAALHGVVGTRADDLFCLVMGGDAALRANPQLSRLVEVYVRGERDCVATYAERREAVRGWLAGDGDR